ncbi:hypothetical protein L6304_00125 [bacterium]|nr:hypothetical protein [bacterium]MCG2675586.1 hypothetical protein [bacterium]
MAITPLQRIDIITHKKHRKELVKYLQNRELIQIIDIKEEKVSLPFGEERDIEKELGNLTYILKFFSRFEEKKGMLESFVKPKFLLSRKEFEKITKEFDYQEVYEKCKRLEKRLNRLRHTFRKLHRWKEEVLPWLGLEMLLSDVHPTQKTEVVLGDISFRVIEDLLKDLKKATKERLFFKIISESKIKRYILLIYLKEDNQKVNENLKRYNFEQVLYPHLDITPLHLNSFIDGRLEKAGRERGELIARGKVLLEKSKVKMVALYDYLSNLKAQRDIQSSFSQTYETFRISGWIRKEDVRKLKGDLEKKFKEIEVITKDPSPNEKVPIALENRRVIRPFEMVTRLYGYPQYRAVDPTPFLAPFFFLFFGLCLTDAGYGIILSILSLIGLWKVKEGRRLFQLLFLGGLAAIICGALTGGWFGIEKIPHFLERIVLFAPLKDPMIFFILALALGFSQIAFGVIIKMSKELLRHQFREGLLGEGSWIAIFLGILFLILGKRIIGEEQAKRVGLWLLAFGAFSRVVLYGLFSKKKIVGMGLGLILLLDGAKNLLGNVLSYSRLMALGLVTGVIAMVINIMAQVAFETPVIKYFIIIIVLLVAIVVAKKFPKAKYIIAIIPLVIIGAVFKKIPIGGYVAMLAILLVGHPFNLAINTLSGFIHTMRLQFVEFFPYFFEGGGRPFQPFKREEEYTIIK